MKYVPCTLHKFNNINIQTFNKTYTHTLQRIRNNIGKWFSKKGFEVIIA